MFFFFYCQKQTSHKFNTYSDFKGNKIHSKNLPSLTFSPLSNIKSLENADDLSHFYVTHWKRRECRN